MKICSKCGKTKSLAEFYKEARSSDGLRYDCKACAKIVHLAYRVANREKDRDRSALWRANNPEKAKERAAAYRASHPEKVKASSAAWRAENHAKYKEYVSAWSKANTEYHRIKEHNRRARKLESGGKLSNGLAEKLFKLQRGKCACCGNPLGDDYHLDHIMPLSLGGPNIDSNIQLLRQACNNQKYTKHPIDFMQSRGFLL